MPMSDVTPLSRRKKGGRTPVLRADGVASTTLSASATLKSQSSVLVSAVSTKDSMQRSAGVQGKGSAGTV